MGFIDEGKLSKNTEYYGYYQLVLSELEMIEEDIIEKYNGLNQIENQFKIMSPPYYLPDFTYLDENHSIHDKEAS